MIEHTLISFPYLVVERCIWEPIEKNLAGVYRTFTQESRRSWQEGVWQDLLFSRGNWSGSLTVRVLTLCNIPGGHIPDGQPLCTLILPGWLLTRRIMPKAIFSHPVPDIDVLFPAFSNPVARAMM